MTAAHRVAVVTGANKGLGLAIVRNLTLRYPSSPLSRPHNSNNTKLLPFTLYLAARDAERGHAAVEALKKDEEILKNRVLKQDGGPTDVVFKSLDVTEQSSMDAFLKSLAEDHEQNGIDVLVNNAGISIGGAPSTETAQRTLSTNFTSILTVTQSLLPLLSRPKTSRIVNVSSMLGKLSTPKFSEEVMRRFTDARTIGEIERLMHDFQTSVDRGTWEADGWPGSAYAVSKAGVTGVTMLLGRRPEVLAKMFKDAGLDPNTAGMENQILINACCPGYVKTDLTGNRGRKTPDQGARTPVYLALGDIGEVSGEFWENEEVSEWITEGKPDLRKSASG